MYRILIFSDTHHHIDLCKCMLDKIPNVDMVLHAGDMVSDCRQLETLHDNFLCVVGNNDLFCSDPVERIIPIEGHTVFLTHGHRYGVKSTYERLVHRAQEAGADIAVFGHTHLSHCAYHSGILLINPGSACSLYDKQATCAILEIEESKVSADIITMGDFI